MTAMTHLPRPPRALPVLLAAAALSTTATPGLHGQQATRGSADGLDPAAAAATITATDVRDRIAVLAHDSMMGRDTPSPELDAAAAWIAEEMSRLGLRPAGGDGGFEQRYDIVVRTADMDASELRSTTGARVAVGEGAVPARFSSLADAEMAAPAVLVVGRPDAERLREAAMEGRHVVYVGPPQGRMDAIRAAFGRDAASVLVATSTDGQAWERAVESARERRSTSVGDGGGGVVALDVRDDALGDLLGMDVAALRAAAAAGEGYVRELPALELTVVTAARVVSRTSAPNVAAVLPGSDPDLADEYVLFSAHMDHIGTGTPNEEGDSIFNGADDDASGTATVMEVAEAMASLATAPRRSTLFLLVSGEEKGLWGSAHFAANPTVPMEDVVAGINADMVGRNWPDTIVAIGRQHSDLGATLERVNRAHPELGMTAIDDLWPEQNFYRRSDHFNFARRGVPILFFFNGTHADYHGLDDEVESIDADKTARIGRLIFWLGLEVANADERPRWDPESYGRIVEPGGG